jgi:transcriptional regulator with XRE-family HTH domain
MAQDIRTDELADLAGISPAMVSLIESWSRNAGPRTKVALARALGVRVRDLFEPDALPENEVEP